MDDTQLAIEDGQIIPVVITMVNDPTIYIDNVRIDFDAEMSSRITMNSQMNFWKKQLDTQKEKMMSIYALHPETLPLDFMDLLNNQ